MKKKSKYYLSGAVLLFVVSTVIGFNGFSNDAHAENVVVYKSPTCGCCNKWVDHLKQNGFTVTTRDMKDIRPVKKKFGVKSGFQSCHTAKIGKYFIEGHVPASDIKRLLKEKPDIRGLSVPGMPMGSPGMEGHRNDKYHVLGIDNNDKATIYNSY